MTDRDSMPQWAQVTEASPFTPPASSATPTLLIALALVALGAAGFWGYTKWMPNGPRTTSANTTSPGVVRETRTAPAQPPARHAPTQEAMRPEAQRQRPESAKTWTRCQVGEQVVYSDEGCGAGVAQRSSADTQSPVNAIPSMPETPSSHTLYRCKPYAGGVFWSTRHCNQQKALVDRMVTVPRNLTLQQKIALAERTSQSTGNAAPRLPVAQPSSSSPVDKLSECKLLDEKIRRIDARTRQPLSGSEQDWWKARRQEARDSQFRLRCGRG